MDIAFHAFDHVTGSYIKPDGGLDPIPTQYPTVQDAMNATLVFLRLNAYAHSTDVEIFTAIDETKL